MSGGSKGDQVANSISVGKNALTAGDYLTSKLHLLVAFDQFLDDTEIVEAYQTYISCGACEIELGTFLLIPHAQITTVSDRPLLDVHRC
jgi:hypothetical protein